MTYIERIVNATTGLIAERLYTPEEVADVKNAILVAEQDKAIQEEKAIRQQAVLDHLGISEEEARLFLGIALTDVN